MLLLDVVLFVQRVEEKTAAAARFTKILQAAEQLREGHEMYKYCNV